MKAANKINDEPNPHDMEVAHKNRPEKQNINFQLKNPISSQEIKKINQRIGIVIADDDDDDQGLLAEIISEINSNIEVSFAGNGKELMNLLQVQTLPDLLFLDLNMPLMNGFECLELIKTDLKFNKLRVLIYSSSANPDHIEKTYQEGAFCYIQKPSNIARLKNIVRKVLDIAKDHSTPRPSRMEFLLKD